jgi:hypothetical protein
MELTITFTEAVLFLWAVAASLMAAYFHDEQRRSRRFIMAIVEDKGMRDRLIAEYQDFKKGRA